MWTIIAVTLVFYIFCGIPQILYIVLVIYLRINIEMYMLDDAAVLLLSLNSAFNPLIYFLLIQSFRDGLKHVIMPRKRNVNTHNSNAVESGPNHLIHIGSQIQSGSRMTRENETPKLEERVENIDCGQNACSGIALK